MNGNVLASRLYVVLAAILLGFRLAAAGFFWDRSVHIYSDLLDSSSSTKLANLTETQVNRQQQQRIKSSLVYNYFYLSLCNLFPVF